MSSVLLPELFETKSPSATQFYDILNCLNLTSYSIASNLLFVESCILFYSEVVDKSTVDFALCGSVMNFIMNSSDVFEFDENTYSGVVSCMLSKILPDYFWATQTKLKSCSGNCDIVGGKLDLDEPWMPYIIFENFVSTSCSFLHKRGQLFSYVNHLMHIYSVSKFIPPILGILLEVDTMKFYIFAFASAENKKVAVVQLFYGTLDQDTLYKLMLVIKLWATTIFDSSNQPFNLTAGNTSIYSNRIFKSYDYNLKLYSEIPLFSIHAKDRRDPVYYSYLSSKNYTKLIDTPDLKLISYDFIEGGHNANNLCNFINLLTELKYMHNEGIVHGDIRESNIIFSQDGNSSLIDFDYSGPETKVYPFGFNLDIEDGVRHAKAKQFLPLSKEHDIYSIAHIMKLYSPELDADIKHWENSIDILSSFGLDAAIDELSLRKIDNYSLSLA